MNKILHIYDTVCSYLVGKNGFMCSLFLQEPTNKFESLAQTKVYAMVKEFKNVTMTCSTSGKLTTFFKDFLHSHVKTKDFFNKIFSG
jgi:hypothetical protein